MGPCMPNSHDTECSSDTGRHQESVSAASSWSSKQAAAIAYTAGWPQRGATAKSQAGRSAGTSGSGILPAIPAVLLRELACRPQLLGEQGCQVSKMQAAMEKLKSAHQTDGLMYLEWLPPLSELTPVRAGPHAHTRPVRTRQPPADNMNSLCDPA
jgi:hypothetical protein